MYYILKKGYEDFKVVDGECAGRSYIHDKKYKEIPEKYKTWFEKIEETTIQEKPVIRNYMPKRDIKNKGKRTRGRK